MPAASHPPKRLRADYGTTGGSATGGKSPSVLNRLLQESSINGLEKKRCSSRSYLTFITSCCDKASPWRRAADRTDFATGYAAVDYDLRLPMMLTIANQTVAISCSGFNVGSIHAEEAMGAGLEETYVPSGRWTRGFKLKDGFTGNANLSLSSPNGEDAMRSIIFCEKRKRRSLAEKKDILLEAKDKEIEDLKSQLLKAKEESAEVAQLRAQLKVAGLETTIAEKDHELSDLGASSSSLKSQNQSHVNQVHELEIFFPLISMRTGEYEGSLKQLEEFKDNLNGHLRTVGYFNSPIQHPPRPELSASSELSKQKDVQHVGVIDLLLCMRSWLETLAARLLIEPPPVEVPATNVLSTVVIVPHSDPSVSVEDYDNPDLANVVPENATLGSEGRDKIDASARGDLTFSQLDDEARDAVL
ncbi:hypothetical protein Tco_0703126 [Tanacetum coccineum]|uniref:Uncharacterized protein n=1 Tax=Tanacetum coccineum TaxID=301880 RepID=A0ABQ4XZQ6_9ASTR